MASTRGRSPRARGSPDAHVRRLFKKGSIPACAGEPRTTWVFRWRFGVDPRVRGGAGSRRRCPRGHRGRSPRARGSHLGGLECRLVVGSIPACAGEPTARSSTIRGLRVDPRVRGGACCAVHKISSPNGRSPRARGSPLLLQGISIVPHEIVKERVAGRGPNGGRPRGHRFHPLQREEDPR